MNFCNFLVNSEKMVQKTMISGNCLQFLEILDKIRENFTENAAISMNFQQNENFEKIWNFSFLFSYRQNLQKSESFEM